MRVKMKNKRFPNGEANVLPEDQAKWEAAGWSAVPTHKPRKEKGEEE